MEDRPNFYAIIPANVRYADINGNAKLLYGEITALCHKEGYCWASNNYFAKLYNVKPNSISRWVGLLVKAGFVEINIVKTGKGNEVSRKICIIGQQVQGIIKKGGGVSRKMVRGIIKNGEHTTTTTTTINNNLLKVQSTYELYIDKFNLNANKYKLTDKRKTKIGKRLIDAGEEMLNKAIVNTSNNVFYMGENDRGWKADLDFIVRSFEQVEKLSNMQEQGATKYNIKDVNINDGAWKVLI